MDMRELREKAGLRTVEVAASLRIADSTVRNWETARSIPHFLMSKKLLKLYKCDFNELYSAVVASAKKANYILED